MIIRANTLVGFASKDGIDFDMVNAHPKILLNMVREVSPETKFPFLEKYCANHDSWRASLGEYLGVPKAMAKVEITKIFYGARPTVELPHIMNLAPNLGENRHVSLMRARDSPPLVDVDGS